MAGTIGFMAPEVIKDEPADFKSDVWSLGIILYALISSGVPFCGENRDKTAENIISQQLTFHREVWQTISDPCKDLLIRMLDKDQEARISIDEVLQHPWLSQEFQEWEPTMHTNWVFSAYAATDNIVDLSYQKYKTNFITNKLSY